MRTHRIIEAATFIIFMPFAMYLGDLAAFYVARAFFFLYEGLWAIRYRLDALLERTASKPSITTNGPENSSG